MTFLYSIFMFYEGWRDVEDDHLPVSFNTVAVLISPVFSEVPQLLPSIGVLSQGWRDVAEYNIPVSLNSICSHLSGLLRGSPIPILSGGALSNRKDVKVKDDNMPVYLIVCSHLSGRLPGGSTIPVFYWNALSGWIDVKEVVMLAILNCYTHIISGRIPWRFLSSIPMICQGWGVNVLSSFFLITIVISLVVFPLVLQILLFQGWRRCVPIE